MVIWGHVRGRKDNHSTFGWKWRNPQVSKVTAPFSSDGKKYRILQTFVTVNDPLKKRGEKKTPIKTHSRHLIRPVDPDFSLLVVFDTFLFLPESYSNLERRKNVISKDPSSHDPTRVNWQQNVYKPPFFFFFVFCFLSPTKCDNNNNKVWITKMASHVKDNQKNGIFPSKWLEFSITHLKTDGVSWPTTFVSPPTEISNHNGHDNNTRNHNTTSFVSVTFDC